jgi:hypothetical protein
VTLCGQARATEVDLRQRKSSPAESALRAENLEAQRVPPVFMTPSLLVSLQHSLGLARMSLQMHFALSSEAAGLRPARQILEITQGLLRALLRTHDGSL